MRPETIAAGEEHARLAVVSTPRSGNTWVRGMLSRLYGLQEFAIHAPEELDWDALPPRCVVQIHWLRTEPFVDLLRRHGFRVVVLARHPLDVMISTLNYTYYAHDREACTVGESCRSCAIHGRAPRDAEFLDYACEWPGEKTLAYSVDWWDDPEAHPVRYEDLVERPAEALGRLMGSIGLEARRPIAEAVADYDMTRLRELPEAWHYHYWQGRPGLWRMLLPEAEARRIAEAHASVFATLGYTCDPDPALGAIEADLNWYRLQLHATRKHLRDERSKHAATRNELLAARGRLAAMPGPVEGPPSGEAWRLHPALSTALRRIARRGTSWPSLAGLRRDQAD